MRINIEKICGNCGKKFVTNRSKKIYCNANCRGEHHKKSIIRYKRERKICKVCKKSFISHLPFQIYCTIECQKKHTKEYFELLRKGLIKRKDGKLCNYYKLRFEIFKRDNFTCQYCGRNVKEEGIKLHIDHIIPRNKGGKFIHDNLITSCEECNLGKRDTLLSQKEFNKNQEIIKMEVKNEDF